MKTDHVRPGKTSPPRRRAASGPGPRYRALLQLLHTAETLWNASRVFFARWDLSPSQFNVLNLLHGQPTGLSQVELSRSLIMHRSNVTGLVDRLETRGLVQRREDPVDRRVYRVVLTSAGTELLDRIYPHYYAAAEQAWGRLSAARTRELLADLSAIAANAENIVAKTHPAHETEP